MVNPFAVLGKEIRDISSGDLHMGPDLKAPEIGDAASPEALEAYKKYSTAKNLRADRVNFIKSIFDKFSGIALGFAATFLGIFLGKGSSEAVALTQDNIDAYNVCKEDVVETAASLDKGAHGQDLVDKAEAACEAAVETGDGGATLLAAGAIAVAMALSFVGLLFKQYITRDQTDKMAYTNDYYRKAQAEETSKYMEPVIEKQASKYLVSAQDAEWEGLMSPEALKAVQAAEEQRTH